jgi:hypothetical protein
MLRHVVLLICAGSVASAAPPRALSHAELHTRMDDAVKHLPPTDPVAVKACEPLATKVADSAHHHASEYLAAVECFLKAGAIGAASTVWDRARTDPQMVATSPERAPFKQMASEMTTALESAGYYDKVADLLDMRAREYETGQEALDDETRAACLWFQLGDRRADTAATFVERASRHQRDRDHMCDAVKLLTATASYGDLGEGEYGAIGRGSWSSSEVECWGIGDGNPASSGCSNQPHTATPGSNATAITSLTIAQLDSQGDLDRAIVRRYVKRNLTKLASCYEGRWARNKALAGTVRLHWTIGATGAVERMEPSGFDADVTACMADVVHSIAFPLPKTGEVDVRVALACSPPVTASATPARRP